MKTSTFLISRVSSLQKEMERLGLDAFLVTNLINVSYLSGFLGHDSLLLITRDGKSFITDSRYVEYAKQTLRGFDIKLVKGSTYKTIEELVGCKKLKKIGFEANDLSFGVAAQLKARMRSVNARLVPTIKAVENIRETKDSREIGLIKGSIKLTKRVLDKAVRMVRPGLSEEYIARRIEQEFVANGARSAFDPIVAAGSNSSKPHAMASAKKLTRNTFLMLDIGSILKQYNSDITRMVVLGNVQSRFKTIYSIVRAAQQFAIERIRPGLSISEADFAARSYMHKKGFGKYFGHALGHGVGMSVHELPSVSKYSKDYFRAGMVLTVEPAIYIPGFGGARVEDMVLVTNDGCELLTRDN